MHTRHLLTRFSIATLSLGVAAAAASGCASSDEADDAGAGRSSGGEAGRGGGKGNAGAGQGGSAGKAQGGSAGKGQAGSAGTLGGEGGQRENDAGAAGEAGEAGTAGTAGEPAAGNGGTTNAGGAGAGGDAPGEAGAGGETDCGGVVDSGRIILQLDSVDPERVTNLQWVDGAAVTSANFVGEGGPAVCGDPLEFFGQSYAAPEGATPTLVASGHRAALSGCGLERTIVSAAVNCADAPLTPVTTAYRLYTGAKANQLRITRTFGFDAETPVYTGGLRPYVARFARSQLPSVIYPAGDDASITTMNASACAGDCLVAEGTTWNGRWFADIDPTSGRAVIVLRDPALTSDVLLTVNADEYSTSNIASFVLVQPTAGWKAPITEIEYFCFADLESWPQVARDAAELPANCGP